MSSADRLIDPGVIAIVRSSSPVDLEPVCEALARGGVRAVEATLTTPGALDSIRVLPASTRDHVMVGMGSILEPNQARHAIEAGAEFLVTPILQYDVIALATSLGVPVICGAYTPSEAQAAYKAGADFIKLFPADGLGPAYVKALRAPMPHLRIIPTGGVTLETARAFMEAGCAALGVGSALVSQGLLDHGNWDELARRAGEFVQAVKA